MRTFSLSSLQLGFLCAAVILCSLVDAPHVLGFGSLSLMGLETLLYVAIPLVLWWMRPRIARDLWRQVWPVVLFIAWSLLSIAWYKPSTQGFQGTLVIGAFVCLLVSTHNLCRLRPESARVLFRTFVASSACTTVLYLAQQFGSPIPIGDRTFALFALLGIGASLSQWRSGSRHGLWRGLAGTAAIVLSLSRLASAIALLLFPLAQISVKSRWGWLRTAAWLALAAGIAGWGIMHYPPLRDRFFEGDTSMSVGGMKINASGRMVAWKIAIDSFLESPLFGKGGGAADNLISTAAAGLAHIHCDFLRLLHDYGLVGFGLWITGYLNLVGATFRRWIGQERTRRTVDPVHLSAFLALLALGLGMTTDNAMDYIFLVAPVGILVGCSLAGPGARRVACAS